MTVGRLDYPPEKLAPFGREKILMEANTPIEQSWRLAAVAKEPWTAEMIEELQPDEVFWDVGANVGSYSLLAAARGAAVVAFEPMFENFSTLCRNLALNGLLDRVIPLQVALAAQDGMAWLHLADLQSGAASHVISDSPKKTTFHKMLIRMEAADGLMQRCGLPAPHMIKLDVDGGELDVLKGMAWALQHAGLRALMIELDYRQDAEVITWLDEQGWVMGQRSEQRGSIYYARFERKPVPTPEPIKRAERRRAARVKA